MSNTTPTTEPRRERQIIPQETRARSQVGADPQTAPARAIEQPGLSSTEDIIALQSLAGNQAVTRLIQAKLVVGAADDPYEREADRVADQVLAIPSAAQQPHSAAPAGAAPGAQRAPAMDEEDVQTKPLAAGITPLQRFVQRAPEEEEEVQTARLQRAPEEEEEIQTSRLQRAPEEEELPLQGKALQRAPEEEEEIQTSRLQRSPEEEEQPLQGKALQRAPEEEEEVQTSRLQRSPEEEELPVQGKAIQRAPEEEEEVQTARDFDPRGSFNAGAGVETSLRAQQGGGSPLPGEVRAFMEPRFGADFSAVRLHTDGEAAVLNRELHAQAFTHGADIYMGEGFYDPGSPSGKHLLAHELTHVVQQTGRGKNPAGLNTKPSD